MHVKLLQETSKTFKLHNRGTLKIKMAKAHTSVIYIVYIELVCILVNILVILLCLAIFVVREANDDKMLILNCLSFCNTCSWHCVLNI